MNVSRPVPFIDQEVNRRLWQSQKCLPDRIASQGCANTVKLQAILARIDRTGDIQATGQCLSALRRRNGRCRDRCQVRSGLPHGACGHDLPQGYRGRE